MALTGSHPSRTAGTRSGSSSTPSPIIRERNHLCLDFSKKTTQSYLKLIAMVRILKCSSRCVSTSSVTAAPTTTSSPWRSSTKREMSTCLRRSRSGRRVSAQKTRKKTRLRGNRRKSSRTWPTTGSSRSWCTCTSSRAATSSTCVNS